MLLLISLVLMLIAPFYVIYKPPASLIRYFQYRWPDVLWQVPTSKKIVALTIDDAPSVHTPGILQVLHDNNATATFFLIGSQASNNNRILESMVAAGNELANHGMFDEPARSLNDVTLTEQIQAGEQQIRVVYEALRLESPPKYYRPGSGFFSTKIRSIMAKLDYRLVMGGIYPHDAQIPISYLNTNHILSMLRPGGIIVCHDARSWTLPMLRKVLPEIKRRGYKVVTVTELLSVTR